MKRTNEDAKTQCGAKHSSEFLFQSHKEGADTIYAMPCHANTSVSVCLSVSLCVVHLSACLIAGGVRAVRQEVLAYFLAVGEFHVVVRVAEDHLRQVLHGRA